MCLTNEFLYEETSHHASPVPLPLIIPRVKSSSKTEIPCTDEVLSQTPGRWLNTSSGYYINNDMA